MTDIVTLLAEVYKRQQHYHNCSDEQALTYVCEDIVVEALGSRLMTVSEMKKWCDDVCDDEDLDSPVLLLTQTGANVQASADIEGNVVCLRSDAITTSVLLHELAHTATRSEIHGSVFRSALVGLWRRHMSVEHAALLHTLFRSVKLEVNSWQT